MAGSFDELVKRSFQHVLVCRPRRVANIAWHGIAGQPGAKLANQLATKLLRHLEMRGPGHAVELVQVIRYHAQIDQPAEKLAAKTSTSSLIPRSSTV